MSTENKGIGMPYEPADGAPVPERDPVSSIQGSSPRPPAAAPVGPAAPPQPTASPESGTTAESGVGAGTGGTSPPPPPPPTPSATAPWSAFPPPPAAPLLHRRGGLLAALLAATLVAGGVGGGVGYLLADQDSTSSSTVLRSDDSDTPARSPESVAGIAEAALPSVVTIETGSGILDGATGTGFVYDKEGHILTNNHVVAGAAGGGTLTATFSDGESYEAKVVGRAEGYDLAVLRLLDTGDREFTPLPLGDSDDVAVGDTTIAIGAPFGLSGTVTAGIVSAKDRPVSSSDGRGGSASYMSALQTDASINPGNSGGPLLDANGAVIGVNSAIQSNTGGFSEPGNIGLGFAIPINQAQRVARDLIETGDPVYAIIGTSVEMTSTGRGAVISDVGPDGAAAVTPDGPADKAGLSSGDVIVRFGDRVIDSGPTLISEIWTHRPGDRVEVVYERDGAEHTVDVVLGQRVGDD